MHCNAFIMFIGFSFIVYMEFLEICGSIGISVLCSTVFEYRFQFGSMDATHRFIRFIYGFNVFNRFAA